MKKLIFGLIVTIAHGVAVAQAKKEGPAETNYSKEIGKLAQSKVMVAAFSEVERLNPTTLQELIMLTEIPAPPFKEAERAKKFKQMLEAAGGVKVWMDEEGNVLALRKGKSSERIVAIDAHVDTVFPEGTDVKVKMKGDTLYAPGIADCSRGLMVVLTVLRAMEKANIQTNDDVLFVATVGEEGLGDLRGVKYIFEKSDLKITSWISIDDFGIGPVNIGGNGSVRYRVTLNGPGGHSWDDFGLVNPHHALANAIHSFVDAATKYTNAPGPKTTFNVGRIGGGTSLNSIPFESWFEVDMRSEDPSRLHDLDSIFKTSMHNALDDYNRERKKDPAVTMKMEQVGFRPSGKVRPDVPLIQRAMAATHYLGFQPVLSTISTNANIPISKGIPSVTLGWGGQGDHAHSLGEWWLDDKGTDAIKLALLTLVAEAGLLK